MMSTIRPMSSPALLRTLLPRMVETSWSSSTIAGVPGEGLGGARWRALRPRLRRRQCCDLRKSKRLMQRNRRDDDTDHRHQHSADRRDRGRQALDRAKPGDIGDAVADEDHIAEREPADR